MFCFFGISYVICHLKTCFTHLNGATDDLKLSWKLIHTEKIKTTTSIKVYGQGVGALVCAQLWHPLLTCKPGIDPGEAHDYGLNASYLLMTYS